MAAGGVQGKGDIAERSEVYLVESALHPTCRIFIFRKNERTDTADNSLEGRTPKNYYEF